ncbi:MAG: hypothetical protein AB8I08_33370 [Sandaracinaceae bacterium]
MLGVAAGASATVMVEIPLDTMIRDADVIVHGRVVESGVRMNANGDSFVPETLTTVQVTEWLDGEDRGETVTLRELGGIWQGGGLHYEGTPRYRVGEEVILFLERRPEAPNDLRTMGMVQGKFFVRHGVPGVPSSVRRDLEGIAFASWADGQQHVNAPGDDPAIELDVFLDHVRRVRGAR